jgi:aspartyl aminopeptidase
MTPHAFNQGLLAYLDASPTPFHATRELVAALVGAGFVPLEEDAAWSLAAGGRYVVTRNDSSIIAFSIGTKPFAEVGLRMIGAHTDSPCLKLKPQPEFEQHGSQMLAAEVYGGVLLAPWFDRDLSVAGRVTLVMPDGELVNQLVDLRCPIAVIPSLAIHLDREANDKRSINKQTHLPALVACKSDSRFEIKQAVKEAIARETPALAEGLVLGFELSFYDTQPARILGWQGEFVASARLDNLLSCYTGLCALRDADPALPQLLVCNDHEEVGSGSTSGARGNFLESVLQRVLPDHETRARAMARSMLVSTDNAHAVHPNFADRHDPRHAPLMNGGPALKINANQSYATSSESAAVFLRAAQEAEVTVQSFVARTDLGCGSTIGPLAATRLGVRTVDVGVPTYAMHSIRELAGTADAHALYRVLGRFLATERLTAR